MFQLGGRSPESHALCLAALKGAKLVAPLSDFTCLRPALPSPAAAAREFRLASAVQ